MLEVVFIISAVAGLFAGIAFRCESIKLWFLFASIAILTGITFVMYVPELNLCTIFAIVSLIFWQMSFLFGNWENFVNYEFSFLLFSFVVFVFASTLQFPSRLQKCNETHQTIKVVMIMTTLDSGESVYEDDCIILQTHSSSSYHYYYLQEDGTPIEGTIPVSNTTIVNIGVNDSPYLQIITERECSGYYPDIQKHYLGISHITFKLYIPEGSIQNVSTND